MGKRKEKVKQLRKEKKRKEKKREEKRREKNNSLNMLNLPIEPYKIR
jgi:hypothetical protein